MGLNRRKLKEWVSRRCLTPPPPTSFALHHIGRHGPALVCRLEAEGAPDDRGDAVERLVSEEVADHVEGWPGLQQYKVVALDAKDQPMGEWPFTMQAAGARDDATSHLALPTPDMGGMGAESLNHAHTMVTVQQMRHNEGFARALVELAMSSRERDADIIAKQQRQIDKYADRQLDVIEMMEGLMTRKQEREIAHATYEEDKHRKDQVLSKITQYILPAMAREAGVQLPEDVGESIKMIFLRLPEDTQSLIIKQLPEIDRAKLFEVLEAEPETKH
jgi:hypothetical protein